MKFSAVAYFSCLSCSASLTLKQGYTCGNGQFSGEVISGVLACTACIKEYPVTKGVPRFVDERVTSSFDIRTGQNFARSWQQFPRLDERYHQQFFDWLNPVDPAYLKDKIILEAGCGKGRHTKIVAECGAREIFAVDIGEAVDLAFKNAGYLSGVNIVQANLNNMPFGKIFDFAFSLGVLHHLKCPADGLANLASKLKENGAVSVWVYGRENNGWIVHLVSPVRITMTSRLPVGVLRVISAAVALPVYVWAKGISRPWTALRRQLPFLPELFYEPYMSYIARFDYEEFHHIVFDHLVAPVANYILKEDFVSWFAQAGFADPLIRWHNKNSWAAFASFCPEELERMRLSLLNAKQRPLRIKAS